MFTKVDLVTISSEIKLFVKCPGLGRLKTVNQMYEHHLRFVRRNLADHIYYFTKYNLVDGKVTWFACF